MEKRPNESLKAEDYMSFGDAKAEAEIKTKPAQKEKLHNEEVEETESVPDRLTEQEEVEVKTLAQNWLEDFYEKYSNPENFASPFIFNKKESITGRLAASVGVLEEYEKGYLPYRYALAIELFLEELIIFTKNKSTTIKRADVESDEQKKFNAFNQNIYHHLFSFSPGVEQGLRLPQKLIITAKANRVPEVQGWAGQKLVGEMAYDINFASPDYVDTLAPVILGSSVAEQLDCVNQLKRVAQNAAAQGWADEGFHYTVHLLELVSNSAESPIVQYACEHAVEDLKTELENPTTGVVTFYGNRAGGRSRERKAEDVEQLQERIYPDIRLVRGDSLVRIASDAIAVVDHSAYPRFISRDELVPAEAGLEYKVSSTTIDEIKEDLKTRNLSSLEELTQLLSYLEKYVMTPQLQGSSEGEAVLWHRCLPMVSEKQWKDFHTSGRNWEQARVRGDAQQARNDFLRKRILLARKLSESPDNVKLAILRFLDAIPPEQVMHLQRMHFTDVEAIIDDPYLNPLINSIDADTALLLQQLHQYDIRTAIEQDLHIDLTCLPLRSQIQFLKYLSGQDRAGFNRLRQVLHSHEQQADSILYAFLACAENSEYGEVILSLTEQLEPSVAEQVFAKYNEIAETTNNLERYLASYFTNGQRMATIDARTVTQRILSKANNLLLELQSSLSTPEAIVAKLQNISAEITLFTATFKEVASQGGVELTDVAGLQNEVMTGPEVTEQDQQAMLRIYKANWSNKSTDAYREQLFQKLTESFANPNSRFYVLRHNSQIIAFARFTEEVGQKESGPVLHAGAFNVDTSYQGGKIGEVFLLQVLQQAMDQSEYPVVAETSPNNPMLKKYLSIGFTITEEAVIDGEQKAILIYKKPRSNT